MWFSFKLAHRLARLKRPLAGLGVAGLAACATQDRRVTGPADRQPITQLTVVPHDIVLEPSAVLQFQAFGRTSMGESVSVAVGWTASAGTITPAGLYTADSGFADADATVTATEPSSGLSASASVRRRRLAAVIIVPDRVTLAAGETQVFTAYGITRRGDSVSVSVSYSTDGGSVTSGGLYTAPQTGGTFLVIARLTSGSLADTGTVTVTEGGTPVHAGHYAAPTGTSLGDGTAERPWDLATALAGGNGAVQPGDTVWLRGGLYHGTVVSSLRGTASAPIVVRQYPDERAVIDGNGSSSSTLVVDGAYTWYWGFEIMNSSSTRLGSGLALRPAGVYVRNASSIKLINLHVHDTGHGSYVENGAHDIEIYGWIIYNGGSENSTRADGHGIYIKNDGLTPKVIRDNVIFNQWGFGVHAYDESGGALKHMVFEGNVAFNNGEPSRFDSPNFLVGGTSVADNDSIRDNMFYFSPGHGPRNVRIGYQTVLNGAGVFTGNYVVGGVHVVDITRWENLLVAGNTLVGSSRMAGIGDANTAAITWTANTQHRDPAALSWRFLTTDYSFAGWRQATGLGGSDAISALPPSSTRVFVRPNRYEPGRGHVIVYNWSGEAAVSVDLAGVVRIGDRYEIRSVQALSGPPTATGIYGGGLVSVPVGGVSPTAPIGGSPVPLLITGPAFDVYLVTSRAP